MAIAFLFSLALSLLLALRAFMDNGISDALAAYVTKLNAVTYTCHLFQNNVTPTNADTLGTYTEATFTGYASQNLSGWTAASVSAHVASTTANPVTFTLTAGSQNVYGYYILDNSGNLVCAQRDPAAPVAMTTTVNTYQVTPSITTQST